MKVLIDISESESIALGYLGGIDGRNRKNFIEQVLRKHVAENMDMIPAKTRREMRDADKQLTIE